MQESGSVEKEVVEAVGKETSAHTDIDVIKRTAGGDESNDLLRDEVENLLTSNRIDDALELLESSHLNDSIWYYLVLSEAYLVKENYPLAIGAADAALILDPHSAEAYYQRAQARVGIEEYSEAVADITRFIALTTDPELESHARVLQTRWREIQTHGLE